MLGAADYPRLDYDHHARTVPADDFWGQVRRTVGGQPLPSGQIDMIVQTILDRLCLTSSDTLLDFCCGNGALSALLFPHIGGFHGVDCSPYLISVAQDVFAKTGFDFAVADAAAFAASSADPMRFTSALCYGSFAYLSDADAVAMLRDVATRCRHVRRFFLGNLPDADRADAFYRQGLPYAAEMADPHSTIGVWRSPAEVARLAQAAGWRAEVSVMPGSFFASHYRFDALLVREDAA